MTLSEIHVVHRSPSAKQGLPGVGTPSPLSGDRAPIAHGGPEADRARIVAWSGPGPPAEQSRLCHCGSAGRRRRRVWSPRHGAERALRPGRWSGASISWP